MKIQEVILRAISKQMSWLEAADIIGVSPRTMRRFCEEGFKQCMVGTIALYDGAGERLETIYLGQAPQMGKAQFLDRLDREWQRICQSYPQARRVGLSDGARDYEPWLAARTRGAAPALAAASGYFAHNVQRMNYALCAAMHLPIGSGVTEAACKSLVKLRLCGSGMKWTRSGAQTVLSTSRWSSLWQYFDQHGLPNA